MCVLGGDLIGISSRCQNVYFILELLCQHADVVHPMAEVHLKHCQYYHSHLETNDNETCGMTNILILYTKDRLAKFGACFNILPFFDKDCYHHPFSMRGRSSGFRGTSPDLPLYRFFDANFLLFLPTVKNSS